MYGGSNKVVFMRVGELEALMGTAPRRTLDVDVIVERDRQILTMPGSDGSPVAVLYVSQVKYNSAAETRWVQPHLFTPVNSSTPSMLLLSYELGGLLQCFKRCLVVLLCPSCAALIVWP